MTVIERKPVPIYMVECLECHSKIEYRASEVSWTNYLTCPVCGMSVYASTINPLRFDENKEPVSQHDRLMNALAEIRDICAKNDDEGFGCGKRCPFLCEASEDGFRDCEITKFIDNSCTIPVEWGEAKYG